MADERNPRVQEISAEPAAHVGALLPELVLSGLSREEEKRVRAHLATCPTCSAAHQDWRALLESFVAHLPHVPPRTELRDALLSNVDGFEAVPPALAPWLDSLAVLFDLPYPEARRLLNTLDDPAGWRPMGPPGISVKRVRAGSRREGAQACLVRLEAGSRFPKHRHDGNEHVLVLTGGLREDSGARQHAGELTKHQSGSAHAFVALPGEPCVAAVLSGGLTMLE